MLSPEEGEYFLVEFTQMTVFREFGECADYRNKPGVLMFLETICL